MAVGSSRRSSFWRTVVNVKLNSCCSSLCLRCSRKVVRSSLELIHYLKLRFALYAKVRLCIIVVVVARILRATGLLDGQIQVLHSLIVLPRRRQNNIIRLWRCVVLGRIQRIQARRLDAELRCSLCGGSYDTFNDPRFVWLLEGFSGDLPLLLLDSE
jgi:hypothetical protein